MHLLNLTNCIVNSHVLQGPIVTGILTLMHKDIQCGDLLKCSYRSKQRKGGLLSDLKSGQHTPFTDLK